MAEVAAVFSFMVGMMRWSVILGIAAAMTLAALLLRLRYEGSGRFQLGFKSRPGLAGTLVWADDALPPPAPAPRRPLDAGAQACAGTRDQLAQAVRNYEARTRRPMPTLDIFALLEAEVLRELPGCPRGGAFTRKPGGAVACSLHGE